MLQKSIWKPVQIGIDCGIDLTRIKDHRKHSLFASSKMPSLASFFEKVKKDGRKFWQL